MKTTIDKFLQSRTIGVAGISSKSQKFGNALYREITKSGYEVYPVARSAESIDGKTCLKEVSSLYGITENLIIATGKQDAADIVNSLDPSRIKRIWFSKGSESDDALTAAKDKNIESVHGICPLLFFRPVGFHGFHLFFSKIFGDYRKVYS